MNIRYIRQIVLPEIGIDGQCKIKDAKVLCVGAGGLGSPVLSYLASAGIGRIGIVDFDIVDLSNLHRQTIFNDSDIGRLKVKVASVYLKSLNPEIVVDEYCYRLSIENAYIIISKYDIVVDCTDNLESKFLINDWCMKLDIPMVYGAVFGFEGYVSVFLSKYSCYRCLYKDFRRTYIPSCSENGVLGILPGIIGTIQALEVVKLALLNNNFDSIVFKPLISVLLIFRAKYSEFKLLRYKKRLDCVSCGIDSFVYAGSKYILNKNLFLNFNFIDFRLVCSQLNKFSKFKLIFVCDDFSDDYINNFTIEFRNAELLIIDLKFNSGIINFNLIMNKIDVYVIYSNYSVLSSLFCGFFHSIGYENVFYLLR
ncbi:MAG TPA: HesA/MoeB/ThiF family protein [Candidatus Azoamicus sp. OHIO1]